MEGKKSTTKKNPSGEMGLWTTHALKKCVVFSGKIKYLSSWAQIAKKNPNNEHGGGTHVDFQFIALIRFY